MAKISLRSYNREIESLIDQGHVDQAIAHCKYILKIFPKHIDTYRLLGKSYIEKQRFGEASDILQRVLSVIPDDFISHAGMSIIREDEKNLDAAIWHMERAFEVQPSNTNIQNELRRLYGRRDGVEPAKPPMTRSALVRMYARGDLYSQAITEALAATKEDPNRPDLEVILARMYFLSHQSDEAVTICNRLLRKLPFCYEANRILADILSKDNPEQAETYRQKIYALDPYTNFLSSAVPNPAQIPDNAVMLEKLEWQPSLAEDSQPEWATTVGVEFESFNAENDSSNPSEDNLPDWMKAAGWSETNNIEQEHSASQISQPAHPFQADEKIQSQNLPDSSALPLSKEGIQEIEFDENWAELDNSLQIKELLPSEENIELPEWLNQNGLGGPSQPEQTPDTLGVINEKPLTQSINQNASSSESQNSFEDGYSWMENLAAKQGADEESLFNPPAMRQDTPPAWLSAEQTETTANIAPVTDKHHDSSTDEELPDWLQEMADAPLATEPEDHQSEIDALLKSASTDSNQEKSDITNEPENLLEQNDDASLPEWLQEMAETPLSTEPEDHQSEIDELLKVAAYSGLPEATADFSSLTPAGTSESQAPDVSNEPFGTSLAEIVDSQNPSPEIEDVSTLSDNTVPIEELPSSSIEGQLTTEGTLQVVSGSGQEDSLPEWLSGDEQNALAETFASDIEVDHFLESAIGIEGAGDSELVFTGELDSSQVLMDNLIPVASLEESSEDEEKELERLLKEYQDQEISTTPVNQQGNIDHLLVSSLENAGNTEIESGEPEITEDIDSLIDSEPLNKWLPELETTTPEDEIPQLVGDGDIASELSESSEKETIDTVDIAGLIENDEISILDQIGVGNVEGSVPDWLIDEAIPASEPIDHQAEIDMLLSNATRESTDGEDTDSVLERTHIKPQILEEEEILPDWVFDKAETSTKEVRTASPDVQVLPPMEESLPAWVFDEPTTRILSNQPLNTLEEDQSPSWVHEIVPDFTSKSRKTTTLAPSEASAVRTKAQNALQNGRLDSAIEEYRRLISSRILLEETIEDITGSLHRYAVDASIWQILGEAYSQCDRLQDALDAYTKAEEMLR